jgi:5-methylcytosine-specific restriction endonuclease McrA
MYLRRASQVKYDFIKEEVKFLKHYDECVIDNFIGIYGGLIRNFTRESLIQQISDYYNPKDDCQPKSPLDEGINIKHVENTWSFKDGVTPGCIDYLCRKYDISHYAYDILQKCFIKYVSKNQNLPALCYYAVDHHMYLIKDAKLIKSLVEKAKVKDLNSVNLNENLCEKKSPFADANIYENVEPKNMTKLTASENVIIYSRLGFNSINDILIDCIKLYGVPSAIKSSRSQIQQFAYTINNKTYILSNDPNDVKVMNWKTVQNLCIRNKIEFTNQTFTKYCQQMKDKFETPVRKEFNDDEKHHILKLHKFKCKLCDIAIGGKVKFDIDHIRPLSNGGSNELDNIQPLCKPCHKDKTLNEQLEGAFNKVDDAISTIDLILFAALIADCKSEILSTSLVCSIMSTVPFLSLFPNIQALNFGIIKLRYFKLRFGLLIKLI